MLLAYIPINAFSRYREYRADAGAARLTTAQQMINALKSIDKEGLLIFLKKKNLTLSDIL